MDVALRTESQLLAEEVYALIQELDPATWRADLEAAARARLAAIRDRARLVLARIEAERAERSIASSPRFEEALRTLVELSDEASRRASRKRAEWRATFKRLQPEYAALAQRLRSLQIELPRLRPTNSSRSLLHIASGVAVLFMLHHVLSHAGALIVGGSLVAAAWTMEISRRKSARVNDALMAMLGRFAHGHEWQSINSATWYASALLIMVVAFPLVAATTGAMVLALADPAAALVGRRFGRVKLINGRSLEGSLTFLLVAAPTAWAVLGTYGPALSLDHSLLVAGAAALVGALVELLTRHIDDNFTIPMAVAAAVAAGLALG